MAGGWVVVAVVGVVEAGFGVGFVFGVCVVVVWFGLCVGGWVAVGVGFLLACDGACVVEGGGGAALLVVGVVGGVGAVVCVYAGYAAAGSVYVFECLSARRRFGEDTAV